MSHRHSINLINSETNKKCERVEREKERGGEGGEEHVREPRAQMTNLIIVNSLNVNKAVYLNGAFPKKSFSFFALDSFRTKSFTF